MTIDYIIIQAGGKGTRLEKLTRNKPKGIVPVNNLPIIFHAFRKYPDKKFIIIGDYKYDILDEYLESFANVMYLTVNSTESTGTCAGIQEALTIVPDAEPLLIMWSDLILGDACDFDSLEKGNYIGLSRDFECRYSYIEGQIEKIPSSDKGVAGLFIFTDKGQIEDVPKSGELVKWIGENVKNIAPVSLMDTLEVGNLPAIAAATKKSGKYRCRAFNSMEEHGDTLIKKPVDEQGRKLAIREINWYKTVEQYHYSRIPKIFSYDPLTMQKIDGENIYRTNLTFEQRKCVVDKIIAALQELHNFNHAKADQYSLMSAYYDKTISRIEKVRDLIPFAEQKVIRVNGKDCKNIYLYKKQFRTLVKKVLCNCEQFDFIHGDCTFSNMMVDKNFDIVFLDPRGYFGHTELYGDPYYDWAKVYYSISGNYDQFNNHEFELNIDYDNSEINLEIASNGWEDVADYYLDHIPDCNIKTIHILHAIIWISLTTYAWEDFDSICGAFYKGIYLLNEFL